MNEGGTYDLIIIGGGPAGLSAAVNAKARNLKAVLIESRGLVSKVKWYPEVTNYLGFPSIPGSELAQHFAQHFTQTRYEILKEKVLKVTPLDGELLVGTENDVYQSTSVIVAVGVAQSRVLPGEQEYLGRGVSYCVTCDGALFRGQDVVVVGYVPEGEEEANALAGFARSVTYVATYENVATLEKAVRLVRQTPVAIQGNSKATALKTSEGELPADGIFIMREAIPMSTLFDDIEMSGNFIAVDRKMATNIPGVFAAGDCAGPPFQIAKAVGEGQVAALNSALYLNSMKRES